MRRHALLGVLAAISCARQTTAWDYQCWDCVAFRASLWLPFSEGDIQSRQWAVAAKMAADQFNARNGSIVAEFSKLPPAGTFKFSVDVWDTSQGPTEAINARVAPRDGPCHRARDARPCCHFSYHGIQFWAAGECLKLVRRRERATGERSCK